MVDVSDCCPAKTTNGALFVPITWERYPIATGPHLTSVGDLAAGRLQPPSLRGFGKEARIIDRDIISRGKGWTFLS